MKWIAGLLMLTAVAGCLQTGVDSADDPVPDGKPSTTFSQHLIEGSQGWEPTGGIDDHSRIFVAGLTSMGLPQTTSTILHRSDDAGASWEDFIPNIQGVPTQPTSVTALDPYVHVDSETGSVFVSTLATPCLYLSRTDDGGQTWPVNNPVACSGQPADHQTIFTGPTNLPTQGYPNAVYLCYNELPTLLASCSFSLDGGQTFSTPLAVRASAGLDGYQTGCGLHGHGAVDSTGRLFLPQGKCGGVTVFVSDDAVSWIARSVPLPDTGRDDPQVAIDAADRLGFVADLDGPSAVFTYSDDQGVSWSIPVFLNTTASEEARFASVTAGSDGRFATMHVEKQADNQWHLVVNQIEVAGDLAQERVQVTADGDPVIWHESVGGAGTGAVSGLGDFLDIDHDPVTGAIVVFYVDSCQSCTQTPASDSAPRGVVAVAIQQEGPSLFESL